MERSAVRINFDNTANRGHLKSVKKFLGRTALALSLLTLSPAAARASEDPNSTSSDNTLICDSSNLESPPECVYDSEIPPVALVIPAPLPLPELNYHFYLNFDRSTTLPSADKQELEMYRQNSEHYFRDILGIGIDHDITYYIISDEPSNLVARNIDIGKIALWPNSDSWKAATFAGDPKLPIKLYRQAIVNHEALHQIQGQARQQGTIDVLSQSGKITSGGDPIAFDEGSATAIGWKSAAEMFHTNPEDPLNCSIYLAKQVPQLTFEAIMNRPIFEQNSLAYYVAHVGYDQLTRDASARIVELGGDIPAIQKFEQDVPDLGVVGSLKNTYRVDLGVLSQETSQRIASTPASCS